MTEHDNRESTDADLEEASSVADRVASLHPGATAQGSDDEEALYAAYAAAMRLPVRSPYRR
jgi:hypothetical protein